MTNDKLRDRPATILTALLGAEKAQAALAALADAGWACVPIEATARMIEAGWSSAHWEDAKGTWDDMVASALATQEGEIQDRSAACFPAYDTQKSD
jgi:TnpA family transposase